LGLANQVFPLAIGIALIILTSSSKQFRLRMSFRNLKDRQCDSKVVATLVT
jgi:hypothetical protein